MPKNLLRRFTLLVCSMASYYGCTMSAEANMRAPLFITHAPSSALYKSDADLVVNRERLSIDCVPEACHVTALYTLTASQSSEVELTFVLPSLTEVEAKVGSDHAAVQYIETQPLTPRESALLDPALFGGQSPKLYKAMFRGKLQPGDNTIRVAYQQLNAGREYDYGYFRDGRFVYSLIYEVWPLKEWRLSDDFAMDFHAVLSRPAQVSKLRKRLWGKKITEMACEIKNSAFDAIEGKTSKEKVFVPMQVDQSHDDGRRIEIYKRFAVQQTPDRIRCRFGPADLLERRH